MFLKALYLRNFRPYTEMVFEFSPRLNLIYGENAQGKTTILEAIYFLIAGRSFRATQLVDLIRQQTPSFYVEAIFEKCGVEQTLKVSYSDQEKRIFHNHTVYPSLSNLLGLMQGVAMIPDDVALIKGGPAGRRQYLDLQIAQTDPLYVHHATRYQRALRQRNQLLRTREVRTLESWEQEMARSAAYLTRHRFDTVEELQRVTQVIHQELTGEEATFGLRYKTAAPSHEGADLQRYYQDLFARYRPKEMEIGCTLNGPQKDDLLITLAGEEVRFFASEGQQRSCVTALRLGEWERLKQHSNELPLMLLDDVGISLDRKRTERLLQRLNNLGQVFVTSTQEFSLHELFAEKKVLFLK